MTIFVDQLFPLDVSCWAQGGRGKAMSRVITGGGDEVVNTTWTRGLGQWDITDALRHVVLSNQYSLPGLRKFLIATNYGQWGFRFRCPQDNNDEGIGVFVRIGLTSAYQMYKNYAITGGLSNLEIVEKPAAGVVVTGGTGSLNFNTGIWTAASGSPTVWTGTYDIPVRVVGSWPQIGLESSGGLFSWQSIHLREWRSWATG